LEKKLVVPEPPVKIISGVPTKLNQLFLEGKIDLTPLSSIEYARHQDKGIILPDISISADGSVGSILLFSRRPVTELDGCTVAVSKSSATSVVMLQVLFEHYYHLNAAFVDRLPDLDAMLKEAEAALLIGDEALIGRRRVQREGLPFRITDLGEVWKHFTGEKMVYALWVVRREFACRYPEETRALANILTAAKEEGMKRLPEIIRVGQRRTGLPGHVVEEYFSLVRYGFDAEYRRALLLFYDYAYKSGLIDDRVKTLAVWGDDVV
jgi:chorismate dehydratase